MVTASTSGNRDSNGEVTRVGDSVNSAIVSDDGARKETLPPALPCGPAMCTLCGMAVDWFKVHAHDRPSTSHAPRYRKSTRIRTCIYIYIALASPRVRVWVSDTVD